MTSKSATGQFPWPFSQKSKGTVPFDFLVGSFCLVGCAKNEVVCGSKAVKRSIRGCGQKVELCVEFQGY